VFRYDLPEAVLAEKHLLADEGRRDPEHPALHRGFGHATLAAPLLLRQSLQWHTATCSGSPEIA